MTTRTVLPECSSKFPLLFAAAVFVAVLTGCAGSPTRESSGEFVDNSAITAKVKTALLDDKLTRGLQVHVETFKGTVGLSGFVNTDADKQRAGEVANAVPGVKSVANGIVVKPSP